MIFETQERNPTARSPSDDYLYEMSAKNLRGKHTCSELYQKIVTSWHLFSLMIISFLDETRYPPQSSVLCILICLFKQGCQYLMKLVLHQQQLHLIRDIDQNVQGVQNHTSLLYHASYVHTLGKSLERQLQHACLDLVLNILIYHQLSKEFDLSQSQPYRMKVFPYLIQLAMVSEVHLRSNFLRPNQAKATPENHSNSSYFDFYWISSFF